MFRIISHHFFIVPSLCEYFSIYSTHISLLALIIKLTEMPKRNHRGDQKKKVFPFIYRIVITLCITFRHYFLYKLFIYLVLIILISFKCTCVAVTSSLAFELTRCSRSQPPIVSCIITLWRQRDCIDEHPSYVDCYSA